MDSKKERKKDALKLFHEGYNCAQVILAPYGDMFGLERENALKIGAPFGGGVANTGDTCGAAIGALMVIGLRYGTVKPVGWFKRAKLHRTSKSFMKRFTNVCGSHRCEDLKCYYRSNNPENIRMKTFCTHIVEKSVDILEDLL
jgi:C_GCAxxG_C_C family probable redox protein